jgi:hypothetical protein
LTYSIGITKLLVPAPFTYGLEFATAKEHPRRCIAFLVSREKKIDAYNVFNEFDETTERHFRCRFDSWRDGQINKKWFHGWDKREFSGAYTRCFVFKHQSDRFYGFLCNPKKSDPGFQVCVLVNHASKNQFDTDERELRTAEETRQILMVQEAVAGYFGECDEKALDRKKH